ncbi:MAG TPA: phage tail protein [Puia sp.]|jgi:phage tail-like protein|nr:phage tail protein [Puia sp.]
MPDNEGGYYPPVGFSFDVFVEGIMGVNEGSFQEVSGLNVKFGTEEVVEGGENRFVHRLPTAPKYENLVLKRGMLKGSSLINWVRTSVERFKFVPKMVVVKLLDATGKPLVSWSFSNAYPVSLRISEFKSQENALVVETLELSFDYFTKVV